MIQTERWQNAQTVCVRKVGSRTSARVDNTASFLDGEIGPIKSKNDVNGTRAVSHKNGSCFKY